MEPVMIMSVWELGTLYMVFIYDERLLDVIGKGTICHGYAQTREKSRLPHCRHGWYYWVHRILIALRLSFCFGLWCFNKRRKRCGLALVRGNSSNSGNRCPCTAHLQEQPLWYGYDSGFV